MKWDKIGLDEGSLVWRTWAYRGGLWLSRGMGKSSSHRQLKVASILNPSPTRSTIESRLQGPYFHYFIIQWSTNNQYYYLNSLWSSGRHRYGAWLPEAVVVLSRVSCRRRGGFSARMIVQITVLRYSPPRFQNL